jgi:hypothetical protein
MRWGLVICAVLVAQTRGFDADAAVLLGFVDNLTRFALERAVAGANRRLIEPRCQLLLTDFSDASGRTLSAILAATGKDVAAALAPLRFMDDAGASQCRRGTALAFAEPGGQVIHVCGPRLKARFLSEPATVEILVIHELLHALGLGENPPTSEAITARVVARCSG